MRRFIPPSIRTVGLKVYLNNTVGEHDGYDYDTFVKEIKKGQNATALSRMFTVSRPTIEKWISIYREEQGAVNAKSSKA